MVSISALYPKPGYLRMVPDSADEDKDEHIERDNKRCRRQEDAADRREARREEREEKRTMWIEMRRPRRKRRKDVRQRT